MKGKRKVHERRHREGAVTTERIPTGELSPGKRSNCQMSEKERRKECKSFSQSLVVYVKPAE